VDPWVLRRVKALMSMSNKNFKADTGLPYDAFMNILYQPVKTHIDNRTTSVHRPKQLPLDVRLYRMCRRMKGSLLSDLRDIFGQSISTIVRDTDYLVRLVGTVHFDSYVKPIFVHSPEYEETVGVGAHRGIANAMYSGDGTTFKINKPITPNTR